MWPETNEQNNARSETVEIVTKAGPNLDLSDFRSRVVGNRVLFTVTVTNNGDAPVEAPFRMDLFRDRENPPALGDLGDAYQEVPGLAAAESTVWESEWPLAPDGEYYAFALVDSSNAIVEANEADNIAGPRIVVVCSTCQLCPPDEYLTTPCVCGEETVYSGYCCDQEWFALGCPSQTDVVADASFPDGQVIEFEPPLKRSSSCAVNETTNSGIALLLLFGLLLLALRHSRFRSPSL